jgi:hypothetical protein
MTLRQLCLTMPVLVVLGCGDQGIDPSDTGELQSTLLNATPTIARAEVVKLLGLPNPDPALQSGCSATMLTNRVFVTAAHCINFGNWQYRGGTTATGIALDYSAIQRCSSSSPGCSCDQDGNAGCWDQVHIERILPQGFTSGASDLAVGRLMEPAKYVTRPAIISDFEPSSTNLTAVGYGCTDRTSKVGFGLKRYVTYFYSGQDSFNYCAGDSGGPTFLGRIGDYGALVRVASAIDNGGIGHDIGADPVQYRQQLRDLQIALDTPGISYRAYVDGMGFQSAATNGWQAGTTGLSRRMEGLQVWSATPGVVPCYRAHVQNVGWQAEVCDGNLAGTVNQGLRMEAFQIRLQSKGPYQHVQYRGHVEGIGWQPFITDGQTCSSNAGCPTNLCVGGTCAVGTTGQSRRLEAVQIQLL